MKKTSSSYRCRGQFMNTTRTYNSNYNTNISIKLSKIKKNNQIIFEQL